MSEAIILNLSLPIIDSVESLSSRAFDYLNLILMPIVCTLSFSTCSISLFVLIKTGIKENIHLYMLISTVSDMCFLATQVNVAWIRCGGCVSSCLHLHCSSIPTVRVVFCEPRDHQFFSIRWCLRGYRQNTPVQQPQQDVNSNSICHKMRFPLLFGFHIGFVWLLYRLGSHAHDDSAQRIATGRQHSTAHSYEILYTRTIKKAWLARASLTFFSILSLLKGPVLVFIVLGVNMVVIYKFNKHLKKKQDFKGKFFPWSGFFAWFKNQKTWRDTFLTFILLFKAQLLRQKRRKKSNKETNSRTRMIISMSLMYSVGTLIHSASPILIILGIDIHKQLPFVSVLGLFYSVCHAG